MKSSLLVIHILWALIQIPVLLALGAQKRRSMIQSWAQRLLHILDVKLEVHHATDHHLREPALWVANHISWLDIHVINAVSPVTFVAKSEVARWPIFGYLARAIDTIFIQRERVTDLRRVLSEMLERFRLGKAVCIFPEGTSSEGREVLAFKSNLFQAAVSAKVPVLPIAIQYQLEGQFTSHTAFIGDMGLLESIRLIMDHPGITARLTFLETLDASTNRQALMSAAHESISSVLRG